MAGEAAGKSADAEEVDWLEAEQSRGTLRNELRRLKRRAKRRKLLVITLALLGALVVDLKVSRKVPFYTASVVLRATEGLLVDDATPLAGYGLANYLYSVALSTERLLPLIKKYDLYPERATFGNLYAVDEFRDFLDIEIGSNFFARARDEGDPQRSVVITIHYSDFDPEFAFNITQDLSRILIEAESDRRRMHAERLSSIATSTVALVEKRLAKQTLRLAKTDLIIEESQARPKESVALSTAKISRRRHLEDIKQTTQLLESMSANQTYLDVARAAEGANQALRIEIIDVKKPVVRPKTSKVVYAIIGLFVFLCLLPICGIGLAAMDNKLHHMDDVIRLGMPAVGHIPNFAGSHVGTLRERARKAKLSA